MASICYGINFNELCDVFQLGTLAGQPTVVEGGLLHRMYKLQTTKGTYAVKAINPQIMERQTAMPNYLFSEQVARIACQKGIPALPAFLAKDRPLVDINGQYFMVFTWFEGKTLPPNPAPLEKCRTVGALLAELHHTDFTSINDGVPYTVQPCTVDWKTLAEKGERCSSPWAYALKDNLVSLAEWERISDDAAKNLNCNLHISHRDLGQKNVLWGSDGSPMIIDWEAAGYTNPAEDLVETALYWAGQEVGEVSHDSFIAFVSGYFANGGTMIESWEDALLAGFQNKLEWLYYNIRRSLGEETGDANERALGTAQVTLTLKSMMAYSEKMDCWGCWLHLVQ
jgi:Ser/Thr protein kinase RdoA (MazF antagonist)